MNGIENIIYTVGNKVIEARVGEIAFTDVNNDTISKILANSNFYYIQSDSNDDKEYVNISNVSNYSSEYVYFLNTDKTFYLYNEISSKALKLALADYNMKKEFLGLIS